MQLVIKSLLSFKSFLFLSFIWLALFSSCVSTKNYNPAKKYPKQKLQSDYTLLRNILEQKHPSTYWYTSKDSMDIYFAKYYAAIEDSMTEQRFGWKVLAPLVEKIHCGHTSFGMSKAYNKWIQGKRLPAFPLYLKIWNDTMAVTGNLNRKDSIFKRGTIVTKINGLDTRQLLHAMFNYMPADGDAENVNYIRLSGNFPYFHRNIFGLSKKYSVEYIDSLNNKQTAIVPLFEIPRDTSKKSVRPEKREKTPRRERRQNRLLAARSLAIDTLNNTAVITLNTFSGGHLRKFFRQSFHYIKKQSIKNVVLDIRNNGGGKIDLSNLLTRYVTRKPFKVADTCFATARSLGKYTRYVSGNFFNNVGLFFATKKQGDGNYHFGHWERKVYQPKKKKCV